MIGQKVGNYTVKKLLGQGGMGAVYMAEHPSIGRQVAIKFLHSDHARSPKAVSRFLVEARVANNIHNQHIIEVFDFGELDGCPYYVMELLEGESLAARVGREGFLAPATAAHMARQVAFAVGAAHELGVVHRDLKPENLFITPRPDEPDFMKVLDFGIAKLLRPETNEIAGATRPNLVFGTPQYMSPEQASGNRPVDTRSDIYSLGVILFHMVTGRLPFLEPGMLLLFAHMTTEPPQPTSIRPDIPLRLEEVVLRAMQKSPEARFQTMAEMDQALQEAVDGLPRGISYTRTGPPSVDPPSQDITLWALPDEQIETEIRFARRSEWPVTCPPGEIILWPAVTPTESEALALCRLAGDTGIDAFVHGPLSDRPSRAWLQPSPTLDEMAALHLILRRQQGRSPDQAAARSLADYTAAARQGVIPGSMPPARSLVGLYLAIATDIGDLGTSAAARAFVDRVFALLDHVFIRIADGQNLLTNDLFSGHSAFATELSLLDQDRVAYEDDLDHAQRWLGSLEDREVDCLVLRRPASALFKVWARQDPASPLGRGYRVLLVETKPGEWVCSVDPLRRLPFKAVAMQTAADLTSMEGRLRRAQGAPLPDDPWFDGARLRYTLFASPLSGTLLDAETVLETVRRRLSARVAGQSARP